MPQYTILNETDNSLTRMILDAWGNVWFQHFSPTGMQVATLPATQLQAFLRTLPLDTLNDALTWQRRQEPNQGCALDEALPDLVIEDEPTPEESAARRAEWQRLQDTQPCAECQRTPTYPHWCHKSEEA